MMIGLISDSHDNVWNLRKAISSLKTLNVDVLIHCGDYCAGFVLKELDSLDIPVHGVLGNVDGDQFAMARLAFSELKNITLHGHLAELELGGLKIGVTHYPRIAEALALAGQFDVVAYGHTHEVDNRTVGQCTLINPGEIMGRKGGATFATLETTKRIVQIRQL